MGVHVFGIRHHGPGCARSLIAALDELEPDALVVEGPADAQEIAGLAAHTEMRPPVAMLIHPVDAPQQAVYFPMAEYSPEWQALRWGQQRGVPTVLMDLSMAHRLALDGQAEGGTRRAGEGETEGQRGGEMEGEGDGETESAKPVSSPPPDEVGWRTDPLALLAEAAGYRDAELWWEEQIERRRDAAGLFEAILEAMRTVREEVPQTRESDLLREASMRQTIRKVLKEGRQKVAVICGAWHAPVLDEAAVAGKLEGCKVKEDRARLKGLPKIKTTATWIPWTYTRLTYRSGYGAGVSSPGWYAHLWESPEAAPVRWIATAAQLLREKDLEASSASVIEAVRLADALAAMRELRTPGLAELNEAILTVLCHGEPSPLKLIREQLEVGTALGEVPQEVPTVPLARDLSSQQKRLRLKPSAGIKVIDLDLRKENDLSRSQLLHRLALLGIPWGEFQEAGGRDSTFHEVWELCWRPEFAVSIVEANVWGNTVESAATRYVVHMAESDAPLPRLAEMLNQSLLAGLDGAAPALLRLIQERSAASADVRTLMDSFLPLARVARYGDVRGTEAWQVQPILVGLFERISVGILAACSSLDDDSAEQMLAAIGHVQQGLQLLHRDDLDEEWRDKLRQLMESSLHGLLRGWATRLLLEQRVLSGEELHRQTRLALSPAEEALTAAAWINGLLRGSGLLLIHQDEFWEVFDNWLSSLSAETFQEMLPLVRRSFSDFSGAERRQMGEKVNRLGRAVAMATGAGPTRERSPEIDHERARKVLPVLAEVLGVLHREEDR